MSKWIVDIHGYINDDYEIIEKYKEPNIGHWITTPREPQPFDGIDFGDEEKTYHITCSECGYQFTLTSKITNYRFCPNCGARMESEVRNETDN